MLDIKVVKVLICGVVICNSKIIFAQCALCTKNAQQLGMQAAEGMNSGIIYMMCIPMSIIFLLVFLYFKYYKGDKSKNDKLLND